MTSVPPGRPSRPSPSPPYSGQSGARPSCASTGAAALPSAITARIAGAIDLVVETVAAALLLSTVVIALIQVFCRYVLNNSLSWPEEMAKFAFVWFVFLGAAMVTRRSRHIVIDLVPRSLSPGHAAHPRGRRCG